MILSRLERVTLSTGSYVASTRNRFVETRAAPLPLWWERAELLHQRRKERFARRASWVVKIEPRCQRRLRNDHKLHAARLVAAPKIEVLPSLSFRQFHQDLSSLGRPKRTSGLHARNVAV